MLPCQLQQLLGLVGQVHRVAGGDGHALAPGLLEVVVEDLGVFLLLVRGIEKDGLQHLQLVLLAEAGGKGIAVSGLALSGEGPEKVFLGDAVFQFHGNAPFTMSDIPIVFKKFPIIPEKTCITPGAAGNNRSVPLFGKEGSTVMNTKNNNQNNSQNQNNNQNQNNQNQNQNNSQNKR